MKIPRILLILVKHCLEQVVWSTKFNSDTSVPFPLKFEVTAFWWGWNPTNGKRGSSCIPRWQQLMLAARALTWSKLSPFWLHFCWKVRKMKLHRALHYNEKKEAAAKKHTLDCEQLAFLCFHADDRWHTLPLTKWKLAGVGARFGRDVAVIRNLGYNF